MIIYSLIVSHLWVVISTVLFVGYVTYADYYDKISKEFIKIYTEASKMIGVMVLIMILLGVVIFIMPTPYGKEPITVKNVYFAISIGTACLITVATFIICGMFASSLRQYFGKKRNKV